MIPESAYCMGVGGFPIKLHHKQIYPYLENRVAIFQKQRDTEEKQSEKLIKRIIEMLKNKQISGMDLELSTKKMIESFMVMQADEEYD